MSVVSLTFEVQLVLLQESEFPRVGPNSWEDAQRLWQREKQNLQETLRQQKAAMMEDEKWLKNEKKLLVGNRTSLTFVNPISVSLCSPAPEFSVTVTTWNEALLNNIIPLVHSQHPANLKMNIPLVTVPKRGSVSKFFKMNLPVLLQDPMAAVSITVPEVSASLEKL